MEIQRRNASNFIFIKEFVELHYVELREKLKSIFPRSSDIYSEIYAKFTKECTSEIIKSNFLTEECQHVIESEIPDKIIDCTNTTCKSCPAALNRFAPLYAAIFACVISLMFSPSKIISAVIVIFPLLFYIRLELLKSLWKRKFQQDKNNLKLFLSENQKLQETVAKSLKFIRDAEVVSFGYTLVSAKLPMSTQLQKCQMRSFKDCMKLRQAIYSTTQTCSMLHRDLTLIIANKSANTSSAMLVCDIPLKQLGPCFDKSLNDSEIAFATDNLCTSVLRDLHKFAFQQRSELLRMMLLNDWYVFKEMKDSVLTTQDTHKFLEDVYDCFYRYKENCYVHTQPEKSEEITELSKEVKELTALIRSAQMHLRNSLNIYIHMQELMNNHELPFNDIMENMKDNLLNLKSHQKSEKYCRGEIDRFWMKKLGEEDVEMEEQPKRPKIDAEVEQMDVHLLPLDGDEDFMEDEIFEGETDDVEMLTSDKENEAENHVGGKRKREKATHEMMMRELASVLLSKTSEEKREIIKLKLFPRYKDRVKVSNKEIGDNATMCLKNSTNLLKVPRRPIFPRKSQSRKIKRKFCIKSTECGESNQIFTPSKINFSQITTNNQVQQRMAFGVGFTSSIAAQAAAMASQINHNDDIIGDVLGHSDSDV